jgi:hypothetical protein
VVVVSASAGLGVGGGPHFFRRCQEGQGSFRAGLAVLLGRALVTAPVAWLWLAVVCHRLLFPALPR